LIDNQVTITSEIKDKQSPAALLEGYRASFWFLFALCSMSFSISIWGLRKIGKVGKKATMGRFPILRNGRFIRASVAGRQRLHQSKRQRQEDKAVKGLLGSTAIAKCVP
jgi:hypothetical protein